MKIQPERRTAKGILQSCIMSCLVQEPQKTLELLQEFGILDDDICPDDLHKKNWKIIIERLSNGETDIGHKRIAYSPLQLIAHYYYDYLPTAANARYYVESFYELEKNIADA